MGVVRTARLAIAFAVALCAALLIAAAATAAADPNVAGLRLIPVGRFTMPTDIAAARDDPHRLYVVEREGTVRVVRDGVVLPKPFIDVRSRVGSGGERGMLSMAFAPDYRTSGRVYICFTARSGDVTVEEYRRDPANPDRVDPATRRSVLIAGHPHHNHNGGQLPVRPGRDALPRARRRRRVGRP